MNHESSFSPATETRSGYLWVVLVVGLAWLGVGMADWFFRFAWYQWQVTLISKPDSSAAGPSAPLAEVALPEGRGGDLTRLAGIPSFAARFEQPRPASIERTDEFGFPNRPPVKGRHFPVVTVGDSYIASGMTMDDTFSARLAAASGLDVYTYAFAGRGPLFSTIRFIEDDRFRGDPPRVLVWGLVEREIGGDMFDGLVARLRRAERQEGGETGGRAGVNWSALSSGSLKKSLPGSSLLAQAAAKTWTLGRYYVFGQLPKNVAVATAPIQGKQVLFYSWSVTAMRWTPEQRKPEKMVKAIAELDALCRSRGIALVALLIPDKEQVYRDWLPASLVSPENPVPESTLNAVEAGLRQAKVRVVNLLGPYREQAKEDRLLYWPDDTHWNPEGIDLAARLTWREIEDLFTD